MATYYRKNPIYNLDECIYFEIDTTSSSGTKIRRKKAGIEKQSDRIPNTATTTEYIKAFASENPEFKGKIVVKYQDDYIGRGPGNAKWVYVYDCENGQITYIGNAIHKDADPDYTESGYNEALWSELGKRILESKRAKVPTITFLSDEYFSDSPAILSYNVVNVNSEEMIQMETIVYNTIERQAIKDNRATLEQILQAVEIETKKVLKNIKGRLLFNLERSVQDMKIQMIDEEQEENRAVQRRIEVMECIRDVISEADGEIDMESLIMKVLAMTSEKISEERIQRYIIENPIALSTGLDSLNEEARKQQQNFSQLKTSIINVALLDACTNNLDRHLSNWAIIRDRNTGECKLAVFDNTLSFIDMSSTKPFSVNREGWVESSIYIDTGRKITSQEDVCKYTANNYPEEMAKFIEKMREVLPKYFEAIDMQPVSDEEYQSTPENQRNKFGKGFKPVDVSRIKLGLQKKIKLIEAILNKAIEENVDSLSKEYLSAQDSEEKEQKQSQLEQFKNAYEKMIEISDKKLDNR